MINYFGRSLVKNFLFDVLKLCNKYHSLAGFESFILVYHRVFNEDERVREFSPNVNFGIKKSGFESHIIYLMEHYDIVPLDSLVNSLREGKDIKGKVAITFDDGFRDFYENAYPVLAKYKVPATVYLLSPIFSSDRIILWDVQLEGIVSKIKDRFCYEFKNKKYDFFIKDNDSRLKVYNIIKEQLLNLNVNEQTDLLTLLTKPAGINELQDNRELLLTGEMVKEMLKSGLISFGSHTSSHCVLSVLSNDELKQEILESKQNIESNIEKSVTSFSYPYGMLCHIDERVLKILEESGYNYAVTGIYDELTNKSVSNPYLLPRVSMTGSNTVDQMKVVISRAYHYFKGWMK